MNQTTRQAVIEAIGEVLADRGGATVAVDERTDLFADGLALDSLEFATLIVMLEQRLSYDPFRSGRQDRPPSKVGELLALYDDRTGSAG